MLPYVFRHLTLKKLLSPMYGLTQLLITPAMTGFIVFQTAVVSRWPVLGRSWLGTRRLHRCVLGHSLRWVRPVSHWPTEVISSRQVLCWIVELQGYHSQRVSSDTIRYIALGKLFDNRWRTREVDTSALPLTRTTRLPSIGFASSGQSWPLTGAIPSASPTMTSDGC